MTLLGKPIGSKKFFSTLHSLQVELHLISVAVVQLFLNSAPHYNGAINTTQYMSHTFNIMLFVWDFIVVLFKYVNKYCFTTGKYPDFIFVLQWEQKVEKGQEDFDKISRNIKKEVARFEKLRVSDFKDGVIKYLQVLMDNQEKVRLIIALVSWKLFNLPIWYVENVMLFPLTRLHTGAVWLVFSSSLSFNLQTPM